MNKAIAREMPNKAYATSNRIGALEAKLENASNPVRRIWLRHLISRNQEKFDKTIAPLVNQEDLNKAFEKPKGAEWERAETYDELKKIARRDYGIAWEAAEDKSERIFIRTGKTVDPEELFKKPDSWIAFERIVNSVADDMKVNISSAYSEKHMRMPKFHMPKFNIPAPLIPGMFLAPILGAVAGYMLFGTTGGAVGTASLALVCMVGIVISDARNA